MELKPCPFCEKFDWREASARLDNGKYAHIHLALGSTIFPIRLQFNYCPVCGLPNPNKAMSMEKENDNG